MNEIITAPERETALAVSTPSMLALAQSAMLNPNIDPAKFQAVLDMMYRHEDRERAHRMEDDQRAAKVLAIAAMNAVQAEMAAQPIMRDAENKQTKSRYARLEAIMRVLVPIYTKHGFTLSFSPEPPEEKGYVRLEVEVSHTSTPPGPCAYSFTRHLEARVDNVGINGALNKTEIHGMASALSYLRRYLTTLVFNIVTEDDDDDGNAAGRAPARERGPAPPPPPKLSQWVIDREEELVNTTDLKAWLICLKTAFLGAPSKADVMALGNLRCVTEARNAAPETVRTKIDQIYNAGLSLFDAAKPTEPARQADAQKPDPGWPGYEAVAITAFGEPTARTHDSPLNFATYIADLWLGTPRLDHRRALIEHNQDSIDEARQLSREADRILAPLVREAAEDAPGQTKSQTPPPVAVAPPEDRGRISWPGYVKAIKAALDQQTPETIEAWAEAQRGSLAAAPIAQRLLAIRPIAQRMDPPPRWLADLMKPPAPTTALGSDDKWVDDTIADLEAMTTLEEFKRFAASTFVQATMVRLKRDNRVLFNRADTVFARRMNELSTGGHQ